MKAYKKLRGISMLKKTIGYFLVVLFTFAGCDGGEKLQYLRDLAKERVEKGYSLGISVGVIEDGEFYTFSYGKHSEESKIPVNSSSRYMIASLSKTMTGTVLSKMINEGLMSIDDPLTNFLFPELSLDSDVASSLTFKQLVTHTAGFPYNPPYMGSHFDENPYVGTLEEFYEYLNSLTGSDVTPSSEPFYSNVGISLLGYVLQHKKNYASFHEMMKKELLLPLGMIQTSAKKPSNNFLLSKGFDGDKEREPLNLDSISPAGGMYSNINNLMKYLALHMGLWEKYNLHEDLTQAAKDSHIAQYWDDKSKAGYGMTWGLNTYEDMRFIGHAGNVPGYKAFIGFTSDYRKGIVILTSSERIVNDIGMQYLTDQALELKPLKQDIPMTAEELQEYAGVYAVPGVLTIPLVVENGKLYYVETSKHRLFPEAKDSFFDKGLLHVEIEFVRSNGIIVGLNLTQYGQKIPITFPKVQ